VVLRNQYDVVLLSEIQNAHSVLIMKTAAVTTILALSVFTISGDVVLAAEKSEANSLVGRKVQNFSVQNYRGKSHSLSDYASSKVVVLAFLGTECPLAKLYAPRLASLNSELKSRGVTFLGVNSNRQDSLTEVASHARRHGIEFPVLKDAGNRLADAIGVTRTPEIVVLDEERTVRYHGRIDDQYGVGYIRDEVESAYLKDAVEDLLAGRNVKTAQTEVVGCFIGKIRKPKADSKVTYSNQVARILQRNCEECHREGEIAPFTLTKYEDVVGWGDTILEVIEDQRMPPWHASPKHGEFSNARVMTTQEKQQLRDWVNAGSPEGDPANLPEARTYTTGWSLPRKPDFVIGMAKEPFNVQAEGTVRYQNFTIDPGFEEDKWVKAAELQPGNRAVVHHILVFAVSEGRRRSGGFTGVSGQFLAAYVPGHRSPVYDDGMAKFVPAGSKLRFQVHYTPIGTPQKDLSRLGLVFAEPETISHVVTTQQAAEYKSLVIPPGADNFAVNARSQTAPSEVQLLAFMPHMHLRGKAFRYEVRYPGGKSEILLDVPHYDFNWQTAYRLAKPKTLPKGAYLHCVAHYDNSEENLNNPDPTETVRWGDQTWNEMMIGYFDVAVPTSVLGIEPGRKKPAAESDEIQIGRRKVSVTAILESIRALDKNKDGKLVAKEVPQKHLIIFTRLDANNDGELTLDEARKTIAAFQKEPR
jgi:peroxiredoxin